jgi:hypothetical protein
MSQEAAEPAALQPLSLRRSEGAGGSSASQTRAVMNGVTQPPEDLCTKDLNLPTSHTEDHAHEADPHF